MPITAQQKLAEYGLTIDVAHAYVMGNLDQFGTILQVAQTYGITNAMLGEIAGWPQDAFPASTVIAFFSGHGLDSTVLDAPPGGGTGGHVSVVGDPTFTEGSELIYLVQLSAPTSGALDLPASISFGTATAADIGLVSVSNGVTFTGGMLKIPAAGVSSFEVRVATVDDSIPEAFETVLLTVDGVTGTGYIADNDPHAALVGVGDAVADAGI